MGQTRLAPLPNVSAHIWPRRACLFALLPFQHELGDGEERKEKNQIKCVARTMNCVSSQAAFNCLPFYFLNFRSP